MSTRLSAILLDFESVSRVDSGAILDTEPANRPYPGMIMDLDSTTPVCIYVYL